MLCNNLFFSDEVSTDNSCIFGPKCALKFLIVLSNHEFQQKNCWFLSKIEMLKQNIRKFPGKLEILSRTELKARHILMNDLQVFTLNKLYVRLPKEKKYIPFEEFPSRFIQSQLEELGDVLLHMNAENVKIKRILENPVLDIESPLIHIHPGVENYVSKMGATNHSCLEIIYHIPSKQTKLMKDNYFYSYKWERLIHNRFNKGICYDEYIYEYKRPCFVEEDFCAFLRTCNLNVPSIVSEISSFKLHYEILYYIPEMID